jgi:HlyD family secretion protein
LLFRRSDVQKTKTEVDAAQRQLSALERLQQRGAASAEELTAARDRLARAQADFAQLQTQIRYSPEEQTRALGEVSDSKMNLEFAEEVLRNCNVHAPFDGTVYFLPARPGAFVNLGELLLQEADLSKLQVRAFIDEPEIGRLGLGQTVRITWDALPGHTWKGSIATLPSTVINRGARVVGEVLCKVDNSEHLLLPNVNVNATIVVVSKDNVLTIPREAIRDDGTHSFVFVMRENRLQRRDVKLGISNLTRVEILNGISAGDVVGVQSYSPSPMADGVEVKIVENPS